MEPKTRRRPVEMIDHRANATVDCERRVREALTKLAKTGEPFTVEDVRREAGVGKTFIYHKSHPELTQDILAARDASKAKAVARGDVEVQKAIGSWRQRALNAENLALSLRSTITDREHQISDLTGQLYDPEGNRNSSALFEFLVRRC